MERLETLDSYLADLRRASGLSLEAVCQRTKIQARFVEALEAGRWGEAPSNTHVRAFSVAIAKACGADGIRAAELALRTLAATAPVPLVAGMERGFDTPAPPPVLGREAPALDLGRPAYAASGAAPQAASVDASSLAAASARLRALPVRVLLAFLVVAGALSYGAAWSVEHWRQREAAAILASVQAEAPSLAVPASSGVQAPAASLGGPVGRVAPQALQAYAAQGVSSATSAATVAAPGLELVLRARRPCWLVLEIDGKRLPIVTMADGDKLRWPVSERAVLLAGNVGALRVWWQGDNLGYLGPLDKRADALVFERGHEPRLDPAAALPLPAGIE